MLQAHPGRIKQIIDIDLPEPREIKIRETPKFNKYCSELRELLETC